MSKSREMVLTVSKSEGNMSKELMLAALPKDVGKKKKADFQITLANRLGMMYNSLFPPHLMESLPIPVSLERHRLFSVVFWLFVILSMV